MKSQPDDSKLDSQKDRPIIYCWFVEDNGNGRSGYAVMDTRVGRPLLSDEGLVATVQEIRQVIEREGGKNPIVIPHHPDWVPKEWKVRNLSTNEEAVLAGNQ
jgi:hypothetical protein